jgi:hypothetical protein
MRFLVRPLRDPDATLDLTEAVIEAIAQRLSSACGGNAVLNRLEASAHLESLLRRAASLPESEHAFVSIPSRYSQPIPEEDLDAVVDSSEADRERQPQGFVVQRISLERAG